MLINNVELSSLGVQLYDRVLTSNNVHTTEDWLDGDVQPTFIRQQDKFKKMTLRFLITEKDEESAFLTMSRLTMLLRKSSIIFDDIDLIFDVALEGKAIQERLKNGNFILTVNLKSDYAKGQTEIYTTDARATDYFNLNVFYYTNGNIMLGQEKVMIRASQFGVVNTFESIGIDLNKYKPEYYNNGVVSNFSNMELNYENLLRVQTIMINYTPATFTKEIQYFLNRDGIYGLVNTVTTTFTKDEVDNKTTIGQIIDMNQGRPDGYRATTNFNVDFTFENILTFDPICVYYDKIENERVKNIKIIYSIENNRGDMVPIQESFVLIAESNITDGTQVKDLFNINAYKPEKYYENGVCEQNIESVITYDTVLDEYHVNYKLSEQNIMVEYYLGEYPNWNRVTTSLYKIKYSSAYENAPDIIGALGIDLDKYHTDRYESGKIYNGGSITDYDSVISIGILQVYYTPKDFTLRVSFMQEDTGLGYKDFTINEMMFLTSPSLAEVIDVNAMRPDGYIFDAESSYMGAVTLEALLAAMPITVRYIPVQEVKTKSFIIKYKQQLSAGYSTINTSVITIEEAAIGAGIRAGELININLYKPEYYNDGIIDGVSSNAYLTFDDIQGTYDVLYLATTYTTQVRYFTDTIENYNWIGSSALNYRVIDFTIDTTLYDLGLNVNQFKPTYCNDGIVDYTGPINFSALVNLDAINITYTSALEPEDPGDIDYPHRILWLQHNDMGNYDQNFPSWTLNHAYINTGVTCSDMSKLTVLCDTFRVFETEPLYNVNVEDAYLFGSITPRGSYYIKYVNNTSFKPQSLLTGINTFNVCAGYGTPELILEESASEGFSANTGITASARDGYSYATLTYTNLVQSNAAPMEVPLFLFACNQNGYYRGGIAGVGIKRCKIYYEDVLIRDFIPVAFYDKIGDKIAPSNCLYDKVTQSFFEDARQMNSFNIMDDPDYIDTNPEHKIGSCYVNYYKDDVLFNSATIWFRGSDFLNDAFDLREKLFVDYYQPQFYSEGVILNLSELPRIDFDTVNNKVFNVKYTSIGYRVTVNYWKGDKNSPENLIASEVVGIQESDFLQTPYFGQIIPINKYKPEGYKAYYNYPEAKVTLSRILQHAPYDIIYEEIENPEVYTTQIVYMKKVFGISPIKPIDSYRIIGTEELEIDETEFAEGVFIEKFIDFDKYYPAPLEEDGQEFYKHGIPFEWYLHDEHLIKPENLKPIYRVVYDPKPVYISIRYYTDVIEPENFIASSSWEIQIDDYPDNGQFTIVDNLPNSYLNKYKPVICGGGHFENPDMVWTFETLAAVGIINIIYDTLDEPHDPEDAAFPSKVLWFKRDDGGWSKTCPNIDPEGYTPKVTSRNIYTPYIDLGYQPQEIKRLRVEVKAYCLTNGNTQGSQINSYGIAGDSYDYFFGYYGAMDSAEVIDKLGTENAKKVVMNIAPGGDGGAVVSSLSPWSSGWMAIKGHTVQASGLTYTSPMPQYFDGHPSFNLNTNGMNDDYNLETVREMFGGWRNGYISTYDENYNDIRTYNDYTIGEAKGFYYNGWGVTDRYKGQDPRVTTPYPLPGLDSDSSVGGELTTNGVVYNPLTITLDAYHNYMELYDYTNSETPTYINVQNKDIDVFNRRCTPKGTLSLFITTNPDTGRVNWLSNDVGTYLGMAGLGHGLNIVGLGNPWSNSFNPSISYTEQVITGTTETGEPIYENKVTTKNIAYGRYQQGIFNSPMRAVVWYVKIWDRDRLVRNMIPVAKGDLVYNYEMPANGLFDIVTETFFGNSNEGGSYINIHRHGSTVTTDTIRVGPGDVIPLQVSKDPTVWGYVTVNYYDDHNRLLGNKNVQIPVHHVESNLSIPEILDYNEFKPNDLYHDGMIDVDFDISEPTDEVLKKIYQKGAVNIYYRPVVYTKTVVFYRSNFRIGSQDIFYTIEDIQDADSAADLNINVDMYYNSAFAHGRVVFNDNILLEDNIKAFIDAPSPVVIYDKLSKEEAPNIFYQEYYRGGASADNITLDPEDSNYLLCDLDAVTLNPNGVIKYTHHYHSALYENETDVDYFLAYQVDVKANYVSIHKGPARMYTTLAIIVDKGRYTIIEERNGWGRLKEYPTGWILLGYTNRVKGPGMNPDYEVPAPTDYTIPYATTITITKMTVDRLWGYCPEYGCWVKTEEISFNQWGKLYNSLALVTIDLNSVDWNNAAQLSDVGIYPESYRLRYHDFCGYAYEGEYTQSAFADLHSLEFIYPETIYTYNVIYYRDVKIPSLEVGRESFSCTVGDWNPDWDVFIETSYQNGKLPTLYRDTPMTLNWDYFGVPKNKYKPSADYNDGLFLWNPRTWDNDDVYFTFEELVATGAQYVLYIKTLRQYKAYYKEPAWSKLPVTNSEFVLAAKKKPNMAVNDIEFKWYPESSGGSQLLYSWGSGSISSGELYAYSGSLETNTNYPCSDPRYRTGFTQLTSGGLQIRMLQRRWKSNSDPRDNIYHSLKVNRVTGPGQLYNIVNISNKRNATIVGTWGTDINLYESPFRAAKGSSVVYDSTVITRATNLSKKEYYALGQFDEAHQHFLDDDSSSYNYFSQDLDLSYFLVGSGGAASSSTYTQYNKYYNMGRTVWYHIKLWENFMLKNYWVPMPGGAILPDGTTQRQAGWYDLMTGTQAGWVNPYGYSNISRPYIYALGDDMSGDEVDIFQGANVNYTNVSYIGTIKNKTENVILYSFPSTQAPQLFVFNGGREAQFPIFREASSATDSQITGSKVWYYVGSGWILSDNIQLQPESNLVEVQDYTVIMDDEEGKERTIDTYYNATEGYKYDGVVLDIHKKFQIQTNTVMKYYAYLKNSSGRVKMVWIGTSWIPGNYTTLNATVYSPPKLMVCGDRELPLYAYPSTNSLYKTDLKLFVGDRVEVIKQLGNWYAFEIAKKTYWALSYTFVPIE